MNNSLYRHGRLKTNIARYEAYIGSLDYELKIYMLICGLWALDLSRPIFLEKMGEFDLPLINKKKTGPFKQQSLKILYQRCNKEEVQYTVNEILTIYSQIIVPNHEISNYRYSEKSHIAKNYIRRFKFFYLHYFSHIKPKNQTHLEINTLAVRSLFLMSL